MYMYLDPNQSTTVPGHILSWYHESGLFPIRFRSPRTMAGPSLLLQPPMLWRPPPMLRLLPPNVSAPPPLTKPPWTPRWKPAFAQRPTLPWSSTMQPSPAPSQRNKRRHRRKRTGMLWPTAPAWHWSVRQGTRRCCRCDGRWWWHDWWR